jgi:hypothetical protein
MRVLISTYDANLCLRNNAEYFEWLLKNAVRSLNLNIVILKKDTFKSNWSGCLLALYQQLQMIRFSLFVWYYGHEALVIA